MIFNSSRRLVVSLLGVFTLEELDYDNSELMQKVCQPLRAQFPFYWRNHLGGIQALQN